MAKKKDINVNFENLKKQMIQKKEMAENAEKNITKNENTSADDVNKNVNVCDDVNVNNCVDVYTNKNVYKGVNKNVDINVNKIVIKKADKQQELKRATYYLKPETIKKIDKYSKILGMGKSEFLQNILDKILDNIEIQK